jgi:ferredoxin
MVAGRSYEPLSAALSVAPGRVCWRRCGRRSTAGRLGWSIAPGCDERRRWCTGHGRCYSLAPELFDGDDYGHSILRTPDVPIGLESRAQLAVESCPESCLRLE